MNRFCIVVTFVFISCIASAEVYKCTTGSGAVTYSDKACSSESSENKITIKTRSVSTTSSKGNQKEIKLIESYVQEIETTVSRMDRCLEFLVETGNEPSVEGMCSVFHPKTSKQYEKKRELLPSAKDLEGAVFSKDEKLTIIGFYRQLSSLHEQMANRTQRLLALDDAYSSTH